MTLRAQPTLEEVAALAGVSRATVSRVVNGSPRVSEVARLAVERAVEELGYTPNRAARSLVTRRTDSVALVVAEPEARVFSDPFFAGTVRGASQALSERDYQLVLLFAQSESDRARIERYLGNGHVDGVLLISLHGSDPLPARLAAAGVPVVVGGRPAGVAGIAYVDADNVGGAEEAVSHLVRGGRKVIATIAGPDDMGAGVDRLEGYRRALEAEGLPFAPSLVAAGDFSQESGVEAMKTLLERRPDIDALFAASDLMAAGALQALSNAGRRVPEDVAVVGFDDSITARTTEPPLTTVRQPVVGMGREMAHMLLRRMSLRDEDVRHVVLGTELIVRASA